MMIEKKDRPADNGTASKSFAGDTHSLPDSETLQAMNNGLYIVVVHIKSGGPVPRYRRYPFLSLASAQLKVDRARMDGREAYLLTYQLRSAGWEMGGDT